MSEMTASGGPGVVLATRNAHKLGEMADMVPDVRWLALDDTYGDPPETGTTFEANALQKARYGYTVTGLPCLADDSGIEVDALGGRPGVYSKRYSPEGTDTANNTLLLQELSLHLNRRARYRCVLALVGPGYEQVVHGTCEGVIGTDPRGNGGFGYDPLFWPDRAAGRTMAELTRAEKAAISHRGAAMRAMTPILRRLVGV